MLLRQDLSYDLYLKKATPLQIFILSNYRNCLNILCLKL